MNWCIISIFSLLCFFTFSQQIPFCKKWKWGFSNIKGEITIDCIYEEVNPFSFDGLSRVKKNGKYGYINQNGEIVISLEYDFSLRAFYDKCDSVTEKKFIVKKFYDFDGLINERYIVKKNQQFGVLKILGGKPIQMIPLEFDLIKFNQAKKIFYCFNKEAEILIDFEGNIITETEVQKIKTVGNAFAYPPKQEKKQTIYCPEILSYNNKYGVKKAIEFEKDSTKIDTIIPPVYDEVILEKYSDENSTFRIFNVRLNNHWGIIDGQNQYLIPIIYDSIVYELDNNLRRYLKSKQTYQVKLKNKWGIISKVDITMLLPILRTAFSSS